MNTQQRKAIDQVERLIKNAGLNIVDALTEIKAIKSQEDHTMRTGIDRAKTGDDRTVTTYLSNGTRLVKLNQKPELPGLPHRQGKHGQNATKRKPDHYRHDAKLKKPYKRQRGSNWA